MSESLASGDESIFLFSKFVALASFASDYLELNQDAQAAEFLDEALADAKALPELPFSPGFEILSVIPELYKDAGHHDKAAETIAFAQEVAERYPQPIARSRALTQVAFSYLALDQPEQTEALLAQAEAVAKADQTASQESIVWVDLAKGYAALGQYDRAFQAIANVQPASLRDQVNETFVCSQKAS